MNTISHTVIHSSCKKPFVFRKYNELKIWTCTKCWKEVKMKNVKDIEIKEWYLHIK